MVGRRAMLGMSHLRVRVLVVAMLSVCLASMSSWADGTISGAVRLPLLIDFPAGGYMGMYEYNAFVSSSDGLQYGAHRCGWGGTYAFNVPAGTYTLLASKPNFFPRECVTTNVMVMDGIETIRNLEPPIDYGVAWFGSWDEWGIDPWQWGQVFHQTFVATGSSIIRVSFKVAGEDPGISRYAVSVHKVIGGNPSDWPQVGPSRPTTAGLGDNWGGWRAGQVPTNPGDQYAVKVVNPDSDSTSMGFFFRPDSLMGAYASGQAYIDGVPRNGDLFMYVFSDNDGTVATMSQSNYHLGELGQDPGGWADRWGQTWVSRGKGIAGVSVWGAGGEEYNPPWQWQTAITIRQGGPTGQQLGVTKQAISTFEASGTGIVGTAWNPDEVNTTLGETYYVEFAPTNGFNVLHYPVGGLDEIPDGAPYREGELYTAQGDLAMTLLEYAMDGTSTPTVTPTPTAAAQPTLGPDLIQNGDFTYPEQTDQIPTSWQMVTISGSPIFWKREYENSCGGDAWVARFVGESLASPFDAALVQSVSVTPGNRYQLSGCFNSTQISIPGSQWCMVGFDLTGQTTSGNATTIQYTHAVTDLADWNNIVLAFTATNDTVSIWLRGGTTSTGVHFSDFDMITMHQTTADPDPTNTPTLPPPPPTNTPEPVCCMGDANHDGVVNQNDYRATRDNFGSSGSMGDANCDGTVNQFDYRATRDHFGQTCD